PTECFHPYSAEIGPLDEARLNSMCLIEYPEWGSAGHRPDPQPDVTQYGSIGELYAAIRAGMVELAEDHLRGGLNPVSLQRRFYHHCPRQTVTDDGREGLEQALVLIEAVTEQGEGFIAIRDAARAERRWPEVYHGVAHPEPGSAGHRAQENLVRTFTAFLE